MAANRGIRMCAEWLVYCLSIGWSRDDLDELEKIWWSVYDLNGNMRREWRPISD